MPRIARKDLNTPFLHIMVQGVNKEYIFNKEEYIEQYLKIIKKNSKKYDLTIIAYCIMNNHAHFLIYSENIEELGKFMQKTNFLYAQMYNKKEKRCGVLFRNRYQTEPIYNIKYIINCINYIHNNPVKAKIVERCEDYPHSSYLDYVKNTGMAKSRIMCEIFGKECNYLELFDKAFERRYIDVEDGVNRKDEYVLGGINEYVRRYKINAADIFLERETLKKLVKFLYCECGIRYTEIQEFFCISKGTIKLLK